MTFEALLPAQSCKASRLGHVAVIKWDDREFNVESARTDQANHIVDADRRAP